MVSLVGVASLVVVGVVAPLLVTGDSPYLEPVFVLVWLAIYWKSWSATCIHVGERREGGREER